MRTKNATRNLALSLAYELFVMLMGFVIPSLIITSYGDEVNGLTATITRLLSLVSLIQAGAVGSAIYQMYKPVADKDYETQSSILYSSKRFYYLTGTLYLVAAFCIAVAYGFQLESESLKFTDILIAFIILSLNGSLYFFFTSKYDIVFSSYQKRYILSMASLIERIVYYILLLIVIFAHMHFIWMYVAALISGLIRVAINTASYIKLTRNTITDSPKNKTFKIPDRNFLMMACIGKEAIMASPVVIITTFVGLAQASVFSVYALVSTAIIMVINSAHLSISAVFGNLVATSSDKKIAEVFNLLVLIFCILGSLLSSCTAFLFLPMIEIYTSNFTGVSYYYPLLALLNVVYISTFSMYIVMAFVSTVYGLFKLTCKLTLSLGIIGVCISLLATKLWGLPYVMAGLIFYYLSYIVVLIFFLKREIAWFTTKKLFRRVLVAISLPLFMWYANKYLSLAINTWLDWLLAAICVGIIISALLFIYCLLFERNELKILYSYARTALARKTKEHSKDLKGKEI